LERVSDAWWSVFGRFFNCPPVFPDRGDLAAASNILDGVEGIDTPFKNTYEVVQSLVRTAWERLNNTTIVECDSWGGWVSQEVEAMMRYPEDPAVMAFSIIGERATLVAEVSWVVRLVMLILGIWI